MCVIQTPNVIKAELFISLCRDYAKLLLIISVYVMYYGSSFKILLIEIVSFFSIDIQKIKITILNQKFIFCNINITGTANNKQSFASKFIACSSRSSLSQNTAKMYGHHYPITEGVIYGLWTMTSETCSLSVKRIHQFFV